MAGCPSSAVQCSTVPKSIPQGHQVHTRLMVTCSRRSCSEGAAWLLTGASVTSRWALRRNLCTPSTPVPVQACQQRDMVSCLGFRVGTWLAGPKSAAVLLTSCCAAASMQGRACTCWKRVCMQVKQLTAWWPRHS